MTSTTESTAATTTTTADTQQQQASSLDVKNLHKLNAPWNLWYLPEVRAVPGQPAVDTNEFLRKFDSFDTIEEFWSIYNALPPADKLTPGEHFLFFRESITPKWEDPAMARGEVFTIWTDHVDAADKFVQTILAGMLGESYTADRFGGKPGIIAGLRYSARVRAKGKQWKLEVWTTDKSCHNEVDVLVKQTCDKCGVRGAQIFSAECDKKI